jgi:hypothetical protein
MIIDNILKAKSLLIDQGAKPKYIKVSPIVHQALLNELNKRNKTKHVRVFEICGLVVDIEEDLPPLTAYLLGEENGGKLK